MLPSTLICGYVGRVSVKSKIYYVIVLVKEEVYNYVQTVAHCRTSVGFSHEEFT